MSFEKMPIESSSTEKEPREIAQEALEAFPNEMIMFEGVEEETDLFREMSEMNHFEIDADTYPERAKMFRKIRNTILNKAKNVKISHELGSEEIVEAAAFMQKEVEAYQKILRVLEQARTSEKYSVAPEVATEAIHAFPGESTLLNTLKEGTNLYEHVITRPHMDLDLDRLKDRGQIFRKIQATLKELQRGEGITGQETTPEILDEEIRFLQNEVSSCNNIINALETISES